MIVEKVYSPIKDDAIKANLTSSPVWHYCYKESDITKEVLDKHDTLYIYTVKFEGLIPFQVTKVSEMSVKERGAVR